MMLQVALITLMMLAGAGCFALVVIVASGRRPCEFAFDAWYGLLYLVYGLWAWITEKKEPPRADRDSAAEGWEWP